MTANGCIRDMATMGARTRGLWDIWGRFPDTGVGKWQDTTARGGAARGKKMERTKKEQVAGNFQCTNNNSTKMYGSAGKTS